MKSKTKAFVLIVSMAVLTLALCACGGNAASSGSTASSSSDSSQASASSSTASSSAASSSAATANGGGKVLVAYFSATGNTAPLAKYAAEALDADIYEIVPAEPYTNDDLNYNDSSTRATMEQRDKSARPAIGGSLPSMSGYDTVVLAYPIWWGEEPRIMDAFVEGAGLGGKTVAALCTSGGSGIGSSDKNLAALADPSATWLEGKLFAAGASASDVEAWLKSIGLL